jgi:hypothetical protein
MIAQWCYAGIFKASPALIDLFRRTVDANPPVTTTEVTRADGEPVVEWNNSPVTVALTDATDGANPCFRPSGVWKIWGLCDGNPPADYDNPSWLISGDGKHKVECRSADMCGNIEHGNNIDVWVDMTPPEITLPALRPNYLTSEDFTATWVAFDATSGVASEIAYLDGQLVTNGQVFDLALMAGPHTLRVIAADNATNWSDVTYGFEVWIDTATFAKPVTVNTRTHGEAMMVDVEFPAPYEVGAMDLSTCRLRVGATIDLHETFPVMGGNVTIEGTLLGGIADTDKDGRPERAIKFDKGQFAEAVAGQTGDIRAVVWGGLLPDGTPRFIGAVTIPVFTKGMASR